ncbi:hypothetical protein HMT_25 [Clostridium phage HM T]|uniref:Uncharacterized protein n=1 Tax=Clostridium saccharoperbutylacetonicum N1-4(HMT) TaxID=931276 RepID=M1MA26_9CLOT|nr:hypothetical protein [Clostridium saccharoperbutylacetonicum]AMB17437.1 hypothetical protein HMT_25 [Clostridium phage HM T]AGF54789.1 hypothetical protein Cspa_c10130 [Clostridium saccharoperbutylacetonicum N1-4(HMT)]NRT58690.1 hypothetical protein [Clostridium saccharoperbutylacetonicum]NSB27879.1 hypothetical protein [Clostridium saccharoperbutylacetonicum]NSB41362.1 hypothetical protein [Clostridium saccharoperbutylacetonicum]
MSISEQLERDRKIKQEVNKIKKIFKDFPKDKTKVIEGLINEAAFMKVSLEDTRIDLIKNGLTELFEQGDQAFNRERPEVKIYSNFMKLYSSIMKQLIDLLPPELKKEQTDALMDFISKGKIKK